jgi:hypothetical protein
VILIIRCVLEDAFLFLLIVVPMAVIVMGSFVPVITLVGRLALVIAAGVVIVQLDMFALMVELIVANQNKLQVHCTAPTI